MFVAGWRSRLGITWCIPVDDSKRVCETVVEVMDAEEEGKGEIHPSRRQRGAEPEVEPENHDFDVSEFLRSSPNLVVASVFGDCEILRRAAVCRGYHVLKSRFPNFWR